MLKPYFLDTSLPDELLQRALDVENGKDAKTCDLPERTRRAAADRIRTIATSLLGVHLNNLSGQPVEEVPALQEPTTHTQRKVG